MLGALISIITSHLPAVELVILLSSSSVLPTNELVSRGVCVDNRLPNPVINYPTEMAARADKCRDLTK